jgi:hypothetical protein
VYVISKSLVPIEGESSGYSDKLPAKKVKKGGYEFGNKTSRSEIFHSVLQEYCNNTEGRDPALEILVALSAYLNSDQKYNNEYQCVLSLLSNDTLATLAIVLQPYRSKTKYISDEILVGFTKCTFNDKGSPLFSSVENPVDLYKKLMDMGAKLCKNAAQKIAAARESICSELSKPTFLALTKTLYQRKDLELPVLRQSLLNEDNNLALAEGELRVLSVMLRDSSIGKPSLDELTGSHGIFTKCALDKPWIANSQESILLSNVAYFFSALYAILRSEAILYVPGLNVIVTSFPLSGGLITDESKMINLNDSIALVDQGIFYEVRAKNTAVLQKCYEKMQTELNA